MMFIDIMTCSNLPAHIKEKLYHTSICYVYQVKYVCILPYAEIGLSF